MMLPLKLPRIARGAPKSYSYTMSTVQEIEKAVSQLSGPDLATFRAWFAEFDAEAWDRQFEEDVAAGRLDRLAQEALRDLQEGRCTNL
jgi:hypothetical protein